MQEISFGYPGQARQLLRTVSVCRSLNQAFHRRLYAAVLRRILVVLSVSRVILRAIPGEVMVDLSAPWLGLVIAVRMKIDQYCMVLF